MTRHRTSATLRWLLSCASGAALLLAVAVGAPEAARLHLVDLGTLGGPSSEATAVNNVGQVVGWSTDASGATRAFLYEGGVMQGLGTLPGGTESVATGINDVGQVVGYGGINQFGPQFAEFTQGFVWESGAMRPLGALYCPCTFNQRYGTSAAHAINMAGQVAGDSGTVRGETIRHAFLWKDGGMTDIGGGAGSFSISEAYGINALGEVVGSFDGRAALLQAGGHQDLGALPGHALSTARAINLAGQVVGESLPSAGGAPRAFLWDGQMHDLGTLPGDQASQARGINGTGQVVGWSGSADGLESRAFLWNRGVMYDLNAALPAGSGWVLTSAAAISDTGRIVGAGLHNGQPRAFMMWWQARPSNSRQALKPGR